MTRVTGYQPVSTSHDHGLVARATKRMDANKTIDQAVQAFRAGRATDAQQLLDKVLRYQPTNEAAVRVLAGIQQQTPQALVTVDVLQRVCEAQPQNPLAHELMANLLLPSDPAAAEQCVRRSLRINPSSAPACSLLGITLMAQRRFDDAAKAFQLAMRIRPKDNFPVVRLTEVLRHQRRFDEAIEMLRQRVTLDGSSAEIRHALGTVLTDAQRLDEAEAAFRDAIRVRADYIPGYGSLGLLLQQMGRAAEAEKVLRDALQLRPSDPMLHVALSHVLSDLRRTEEAEAECRAAIAINRNFAAAYVTLATLLGQRGRLVESLSVARQAVQLAPNSHEAQHALGHAMHSLGQADEALPVLVRAWQIGGSPMVGSNLMHHLNYVTKMMPAEVLAAHKAWAQRHVEKTPARFTYSNSRDADRRLRIGYVSPDFRSHAVSYFVEPLLTGHDRERFEIYCYSSVTAPDQVTQRLKDRADHWREISRIPGARAAEMIHADQIDILVDLAGHTNDNRLDVFAHRPAPVQVTYQGYPNTTGMSAIAYRLTDPHADPPGLTDEFHSEQLIRLPRTAWCYRPPEPAPEVSDLPALRSGRFTFGSFNRLAKVSPITAELWSRAVKAVPGARLVFKTSGLEDPATQQYVREMFARYGLGEDQLTLLGSDATTQEHLSRYAEMDVALDCYPYHGTTTSCEAMWMGVPSIVMIGTTHVSRVGLSLLTSIGLPEFAASGADEFVEIAKRVAGDLPRLAELRRNMRQRMQGSPLMDVTGFCREVEDAYREMWRKWCSAS